MPVYHYEYVAPNEHVIHSDLQRCADALEELNKKMQQNITEKTSFLTEDTKKQQSMDVKLNNAYYRKINASKR